MWDHQMRQAQSSHLPQNKDSSLIYHQNMPWTCTCSFLQSYSFLITLTWIPKIPSICSSVSNIVPLNIYTYIQQVYIYIYTCIYICIYLCVIYIYTSMIATSFSWQPTGLYFLQAPLCTELIFPCTPMVGQVSTLMLFILFGMYPS